MTKLVALQLGPTGQRLRIYQQDATTRHVEPGTQFTDRILVDSTGSKGQINLNIMDVQLRDELDFICQIKSLTDGSGEGRTQLRVRGEGGVFVHLFNFFFEWRG